MPFLLNCWHVAGWSSEIDDAGSGGLVARTICDLPVVIFRRDDGLAALLDRCPHRFAPLSFGKLADGAIHCAYHGLAFDGSGQCVRNPHGPISAGLAVRSFPVAESHGVIWIWLGDAELADPALIPDVGFLSARGEGSAHYAHLRGEANHLLFMDNLMDLSHVNYLHPSSAGETSLVGAEQVITEDERSVKIRWTSKIMRQARMKLNSGFTEDSHVIRYAQVHWHPGNVMLTINASGLEGGHEHQYLGAHVITPETERSSHYFYAITRNFCVDDPHVSEAFEKTSMQVAEEDIEILEVTQERMGTDEFFAAKPRLLRTDEAIVRVRRKLDAMISTSH